MNLSSFVLTIDRKFVKELFLVAFIILNSCLTQLHLLVEEDFELIRLLGMEISHFFPDNQFFLWALLSYIQSLLMISVLFFFVNRRYKYALLFLAYWFMYSIMFYTFAELVSSESMVIIKNSCIVIVLFLFSFYVYKERYNVSDALYGSFSYSDVFIALILVFIPILEKLNESYTPQKAELFFWGYKIESGGWGTISTLFWFILLKLSFLVPLLVFFLTIKKWWRYVLLFPILLTIYQLRNGLNPGLEYVDEHEIFEAAPLLLMVLVLLLLLSRSAYYQTKTDQLFKRTVKNVEALVRARSKKQEHFLKSAKARFTRLKSAKDPNERELCNLKQRLEKELQEYE